MNKTLSVEESNQIIAKFMGAKVEESEGRFYGYTPYQYESGKFVEWQCSSNSEEDTWSTIKRMSKGFSTSWDWIIPVVERIENLELGSIELEDWTYHNAMVQCRIECGSCSFSLYGDMSVYEDFMDFFSDSSKLEATHQAVTEFIIWYNNQQKS